jgi:TM2 domain-containing membrane protein YozV
VAGVASALVPGLGKIYAGNLGEGVASFLLVGAFAALTADSWAKAGTPNNWRTITYGTIGSLLYISNIFGSIASVKVYYQNFEEINREAVMYSIHIPLRELFD